MATEYENDLKHDTLKLDLRVGQNIHATAGNDDSVPSRELGNG